MTVLNQTRVAFELYHLNIESINLKRNTALGRLFLLYDAMFAAIRPETPSAIVTPQRQQVSEGDEVMFYCTARGHPTPSIEWSRGMITLV